MDKYYQSCLGVSCHVHIKVTRLVGFKDLSSPTEFWNLSHIYLYVYIYIYLSPLTDLTLIPNFVPFVLFLLMTLSHSKMATVLILISASPNKPHLHDPGLSKAYSILCSGSFTEHSNYCCSWPILCIFKFHLQSFLKWLHSTFTIQGLPKKCIHT